MGRGQGSGQGRGQGSGQGKGQGAGPIGQCICPSCKTTVPHTAGKPCTSMKCPKCGTAMVRKGFE